MRAEIALFEWEEGQRRLIAIAPAERRPYERVCERILDELRRRLGGAFTTAELAELYAAGTDWCLPIAVSTAPEHPATWDASIVADAAFWRYVREASDFAGGRRR
jgi:hypothetical protein